MSANVLLLATKLILRYPESGHNRKVQNIFDKKDDEMRATTNDIYDNPHTRPYNNEL